MRLLAEVRERLRSLFFRAREEREMDEELRFHLEMETEKNVRSGMEAAEARRQAQIRFGNVERFKEEVRDARGVRLLDDLRSDLRYALRTLRKSPGFALTVILILALGIGVNTALFSAARGLFLNTIAAVEPQRLVRLRYGGENDMARRTVGYGYTAETASGEPVRAAFSYPMFKHLVSTNETLSGMFASAPMGYLNAIVDGEAEIATGFLVSGTYFDVLGLQPAIGRLIGPADDDLAASPTAVISHGFWLRRFGLDPDVVGRVISVNDVTTTIVGVLPPEYVGVQRPDERSADIHMPLEWYPHFLAGADLRRSPVWWWVQIMGRLKPGVTADEAVANLDGPFRSAAREGMDAYLARLTPEQLDEPRNRNRVAVPRLLIDSASRGIYDPDPEATRQATILGLVVGLVLLIVCTNVANLLLSRATARRREIALRQALGATRVRVMRQLVTEGLVLSTIGGGLGILVALGASQLLPFGDAGSFDLSMLTFVGVLSLSTGVVFSMVPALRATSVDTAGALKESSRGISNSNRLLSEALLTVQFAVSVVLLVGAALFLQTLGNLRGVDIGFEPSNILLIRIDPKLNGYEEERTAAVYDNVAESLRLLPGVQSVSVSDLTFLSHRISTQTVHVEGPNVAQGMRPNMNEVSPEFFETMGIPLLVGRLFDSRDRKEAPQVAIVNEAAVQEYWGGENPVGKRVGPRPADSGQIEIVGVVQNVKYLSVRDAPPPIVYVPHAQTSSRFGRVFSLKTAGPPRALIPEVQDAVRRIDPELPMLDISTQAEKIEEGFSRERMFALAYALFGILAMVLASVGLFGLTSYGVGQRTHEFGIRMALGARSSEVSRLVLRGSIRLIVVGVGLGVLASLAASRVIESLLFELAPTDASAIVQAVVVMTVVALVAAYLPARRAASVDPLIALRCD